MFDQHWHAAAVFAVGAAAASRVADSQVLLLHSQIAEANMIMHIRITYSKHNIY